MKSRFDRRIALPKEVLGFLEWSSGVLWINMNSNEYYALFEKPTPIKDYIDEAISHEAYHALQVATSGYMNYYSSLILKEIISDDKEIIYKEAASFTSFENLFNRILDEGKSPSENVINYLRSLDSEDCNGISARSIIEGSAYLWQKKSTDNNLDLTSYMQKLKYAPGEEYTKSFLYAFSVLGEITYDMFFSISFVSLCFIEPHKVFSLICDQLKHEANISIKTVWNIANKISGSHYYLGDVTTSFRHIKFKSNMGWVNPLHKETVNKIYGLSKSRNISIYEMMSFPFNWFLNMSEFMHRPIIFNNGDVSIFGSNSIFDESKKRRGNAVDFLAQLHIAVYCFFVYQQTGLGPKYLKSLA